MKQHAAGTAMMILWFVVVPLALIALFIYHTRKKSHKKGPLKLAGRFFTGAVNIPRGVATVHDGKVYREDEGCHPEYHALYTPNSPEWKGYLPDIVPRVFVEWSLRDDDESILLFNSRIPPERRRWRNHLDYQLNGGVGIPTLDPAKCNPQRREIDYVLRCIAEEFKKSPHPDLRPLQRYFGIHIHTIRKDPPAPPPAHGRRL